MAALRALQRVRAIIAGAQLLDQHAVAFVDGPVNSQLLPDLVEGSTDFLGSFHLGLLLRQEGASLRVPAESLHGDRATHSLVTEGSTAARPQAVGTENAAGELVHAANVPVPKRVARRLNHLRDSVQGVEFGDDVLLETLRATKMVIAARDALARRKTHATALSGADAALHGLRLARDRENKQARAVGCHEKVVGGSHQ